MKAVHTWENLVQASLRAGYYLALVEQLQRARDPRTAPARRPSGNRSPS